MDLIRLLREQYCVHIVCNIGLLRTYCRFGNFQEGFSRDMARSLCRLLIYVNHALVTNLDVANKSFNAICENSHEDF